MQVVLVNSLLSYKYHMNQVGQRKFRNYPLQFPVIQTEKSGGDYTVDFCLTVVEVDISLK